MAPEVQARSPTWAAVNLYRICSLTRVKKIHQTKGDCFCLQDHLLGAALLSVRQKHSIPAAGLQSQERLDLLQAAGLQNVPCK